MTSMLSYQLENVISLPLLYSTLTVPYRLSPGRWPGSHTSISLCFLESPGPGNSSRAQHLELGRNTAGRARGACGTGWAQPPDLGPEHGA